MFSAAHTKANGSITQRWSSKLINKQRRQGRKQRRSTAEEKRGGERRYNTPRPHGEWLRYFCEHGRARDAPGRERSGEERRARQGGFPGLPRAAAGAGPPWCISEAPCMGMRMPRILPSPPPRRSFLRAPPTPGAALLHQLPVRSPARRGPARLLPLALSSCARPRAQPTACPPGRPRAAPAEPRAPAGGAGGGDAGGSCVWGTGELEDRAPAKPPMAPPSALHPRTPTPSGGGAARPPAAPDAAAGGVAPAEFSALLHSTLVSLTLHPGFFPRQWEPQHSPFLRQREINSPHRHVK